MRRQRFSLQPRAIGLAVAYLLLVTGCSAGTQQADPNNVVQAIRELSQSVGKLSKSIEALSKAPEGDSAGPLRDAGAADQALIRELERLEEKLSKETMWPRDTESATSFRKEVETLIGELSPDQQRRLLDRLVAVRWAAYIFSECYSEPNSSDQAEQQKEQLADLLETRPPGASEQLITLVNRRQDELAATVPMLRRKEAVEAATEALHSSDIEAQAAAWQQLKDLDISDQEISSLSQTLRARVLEAELQQQCDLWRAQLERLPASADLVVRRVALAQIYDQIIALRVELTIAETPPPQKALDMISAMQQEVERALTSVASAEADLDARRRREYQRWTLQQITAYEAHAYGKVVDEIAAKFRSFKEPSEPVEWALLADFPAVRTLLAEKTGLKIPLDAEGRVVLSVKLQKQIYDKVWSSIGWNYQKELAYLADREAAVRFLLPIDLGLLELPVQHLYSKAFQTAWKNAEEGGHQIELAQKTVTVKKTSLRDMVVDGGSK